MTPGAPLVPNIGGRYWGAFEEAEGDRVAPGCSAPSSSWAPFGRGSTNMIPKTVYAHCVWWNAWAYAA